MKGRAWAVGLLVIGAAGSVGGWQMQETAADALQQARLLQSAPIPEDEGGPPSATSNREIIDNLQRGTVIRRKIDSVLTAVRASVERLGSSQAAASRTAERTRMLLERIAGALGGSVDVARSSLSRLETLAERLRASDQLGRAIAEELAALDRSMGPSAGRP